MSQWKKLRIKDIGRVITGRTPPGTLPEYFGGDIPFITPTDMDGRRFIDQSERALSPLGAQSVKGNLFERGVAVSCIGWQMGKAIQVNRLSATNQQINTILPDEQIIDINYLYYEMSNRREELFRLASGGSRTPILKKSLFENLDIYLPPFPEQQAIARILSALDDKIELNRQINHTLEEMAHALFESWFVDFDPVTAKGEGRIPYGMNAETAALFPSEFQNSESGAIPKDWRVATINEIVKVVDCSHAKKPLRMESGKVLLQLNNIRDDGLLDLDDVYYISDEDYCSWTNRLEASEGDCVITNVGRVGAVAQIPPGFNAALGRNMTGLRCKEDHYFPAFLITCLLSDRMREEIDFRTDSGTILNALNVKNIPLLRLMLPPKLILQSFEKLVRPLRSRMESSLSESRDLVGIRDALLPKLLSGELRIKQAEKVIENM